MKTFCHPSFFRARDHGLELETFSQLSPFHSPFPHPFPPPPGLFVYADDADFLGFASMLEWG